MRRLAFAVLCLALLAACQPGVGVLEDDDLTEEEMVESLGTSNAV